MKCCFYYLFVSCETESLGRPAQREGKEGHDVQKHQVFHSHTHDFETVNNQVRLPFQ